MNSRQQSILQMVIDKGQMSVADLAKITGVSEVTIRQDLNTLEKQSYLRRAHGFAVSLNSDDVETRMMTNFTLKRELAEFAASLVNLVNPSLLKMAAAMRCWPERWQNKKMSPSSRSVATSRTCSKKHRVKSFSSVGSIRKKREHGRTADSPIYSAGTFQ